MEEVVRKLEAGEEVVVRGKQGKAALTVMVTKFLKRLSGSKNILIL